MIRNAHDRGWKCILPLPRVAVVLRSSESLDLPERESIDLARTVRTLRTWDPHLISVTRLSTVVQIINMADARVGRL